MKRSGKRSSHNNTTDVVRLFQGCSKRYRQDSTALGFSVTCVLVVSSDSFVVLRVCSSRLVLGLGAASGWGQLGFPFPKRRFDCACSIFHVDLVAYLPIQLACSGSIAIG